MSKLKFPCILLKIIIFVELHLIMRPGGYLHCVSVYIQTTVRKIYMLILNKENQVFYPFLIRREDAKCRNDLRSLHRSKTSDLQRSRQADW